MGELPLVYMSTESALKHAAVAHAMERAGIPVRVEGKKVDSGVNEQPMSIDETYEGAKNRQDSLRKLGVVADYLITVESGLHKVHEAHGTYGCTVVIIEPSGDRPHVGFDLDVEYPQDWLDKVPSLYVDMGALVQGEYGATEKDPTVYLTNGRLTRRDLIEHAIYNVVTQLAENKRELAG